MTLITGLISLLVGALGGFFIGKNFSKSNKENQKLAQQANQNEEALSQYKTDVAEHLDNSSKLLEQMHATCQTAMKQMAESTKLLQQATPTETEAMPFFSKETQEQLAQTATLRHQKREEKTEEAITEAPLDYSGNPSGLFDDKKQSVTNAD